MSNISDMNNLVQDTLDGLEDPKKCMSVLRKHRENAIDEMEMLTRCMEEIEGADIEKSQKKVLANRMGFSLGLTLDNVHNLNDILKTTKITDLQCKLQDQIQILYGAIVQIKHELG